MNENEQYLSINNVIATDLFKSKLKTYINQIEAIKSTKIQPKIKTRKISERQSYTTELLALINNEQERLGKKKYDYRYFAFKISHIPTVDLYHCIKNYQNNALFFWSIKVKK